MSSTPLPGCEPSPLRPRFQFDLRTMLLLTALVAWSVSWSGGMHAWGIAALGGLALIEAGCCPRGNVLTLMVRNLLAFFVCSLLFGAFGLGLMTGSNPTGFFGVDHFFEFPFGERIGFGEFVAKEDYWRFFLARTPMSFAGVLAVVHWGLNGRVRWQGYVTTWLVVAGFLLPVLGSWGLFSFGDGPQGWLARIGYISSNMDTRCSVTGWVMLAAALVFRRRGGGSGYRRSLLSETCNRRLVSFGMAVLLLLYGPISILLSFMYLPDAFSSDLVFRRAASLVAGLLGAAVSSRIILRRYHLPLILCGSFGGSLAIRSESYYGGSQIMVIVIGLVAGVLVVLVSKVLDRTGIDDPGAAVATYGVCSLWGMTAIPLLQLALHVPWLSDLFGTMFEDNLPLGHTNPLVRLLAAAAYFVWIFPAAVGLFVLIKRLFPAHRPPVPEHSEPLNDH